MNNPPDSRLGDRLASSLPDHRAGADLPRHAGPGGRAEARRHRPGQPGRRLNRARRTQARCPPCLPAMQIERAQRSTHVMSGSAVPAPRARFRIAGPPGRIAPWPVFPEARLTAAAGPRSGGTARSRRASPPSGGRVRGLPAARRARPAWRARWPARHRWCWPPPGPGASATAAGMAGMSSPGGTHAGRLGALIRIGPGLLIASIVLVAGAFALRHPPAAVPAVVAGAVLYAGMYAQANLAVMYASIAVGYAAWTGLFLWLRARCPAPLPARPLPAGEQPRPGGKRTP